MFSTWGKVLQYLPDSDMRSYYNRQFIRAYRSDLYDYCAVMIWKVWMLFVYEKWFQVPQATLTNKLSKRDDIIKEYKEDNILWPNALDDDKILSALRDVYSSLEKNYATRAQSLHHQRKSAAHVSEMRADKISIDNYLKEMLTIINKVQTCHAKYLDDLNHLDMISLQSSARLSAEDIRNMADKLIQELSNSGSFNNSQEIWGNIIAIKNYLYSAQVEAILSAIMSNSRGASYHQILEAGNSHEFIKDLYYIYNEPSKKWREFTEYLQEELVRLKAESKLASYTWLFSNFDMESPVAVVDDDPIDLDSIPF